MAATTMHTDRVVISDEQFEKLVELLTPGYECSKLMLAELQSRDAERRKWESEGDYGKTEPTGATPEANSSTAGGDTFVAPHPEQSGETKPLDDAHAAS